MRFRCVPEYEEGVVHRRNQDGYTAAIMCQRTDEVVTPDMVQAGRPQPDTRAVVEGSGACLGGGTVVD
jgi:hypothetical protein